MVVEGVNLFYHFVLHSIRESDVLINSAICYNTRCVNCTNEVRLSGIKGTRFPKASEGALTLYFQNLISTIIINKSSK